MSRDRIFYLACFGFLAGVLWRSFSHTDWHTAVSIALISVTLIIFFFLIARENWVVLIFVFTLSFSLGILRFHLADRPAPEIFERQVGQNVSLYMMIVDEPIKSEGGTKLAAYAEEEGAHTKIALSVRGDDGSRYGDEILVTGKLAKPKNFLTDQGKEFDYVNYLRKDGIFYTMQYPEIRILSHGHGNFIKRALYSAKEAFDSKITSAIPAPESLMMGALILGERSSFSQSLRQSFIDTGTIHIVTVSGYHIALVSEWIMKIFGFLPAIPCLGAGIFAVLLYIIITGGAQTAIRAGIMAALALLARASGRMYTVGRALVLAAAIMVLVNPLILAFDVSFELSFLAAIAIIFLSPKIEQYLGWMRWKRLRDIASLTFAAYVFVIPFILYKMGNLSLVALPANAAILPFVPATMILGFITGFVGLISHTLSLIPGTAVYMLLHYELAAVGFFSRLSFTSISVPNFPLVFVILIYAIFLFVLFDKRGREETADSSALGVLNFRFLILLAPIFLTFLLAGFLYYRHRQSNQIATRQLQALLIDIPAAELIRPFVPDARIKSNSCEVRGPLPDHACTPGAIFKDATLEQICVPGYTKTVRNVSTKLRKQVYAEYGVAYPMPRGAYEVDHLIPLALGGSNDIANLFPEAAEPAPGFHEKDVVEIFLQQEACAHRIALSAAERQIADDWLAVYRNLTPEEILTIKKKYGIR